MESAGILSASEEPSLHNQAVKNEHGDSHSPQQERNPDHHQDSLNSVEHYAPSSGNTSSEDSMHGGLIVYPSPKIIVNYLPQTLTDDEFRGLFLSCGHVKSSKVCRDRETGFSYGFGFVEFETVEEASHAIELLNGHVIGHKRLKVAFSRPQSRDMHEANLYMRGLPKNWAEDELRNYCEKYGEIIQVRVLKDQGTGLCRGTGFVLFNRKTEAESCRAEMNGTVLPDCTEPLVVKIAEGNEQKVRPPQGANTQQQMVLPPQLAHAYPMPFQQPPSIPGNDMNRYFQQPPFHAQASVGGPLRAGAATPRMRYNPMMANSSVKMHLSGKQPPNAAAINYGGSRPPFPATNVASTAEMVGLSPAMPGGRPTLPAYSTSARSMPMPQMSAFGGAPGVPGASLPINNATSFNALGDAVSAAGHTGSTNGGYQLFVYNCGTTCSEKELYGLFGPYGVITKVDVVRDQENGNTKFAFVTMADYNSAAQAVQALNGYCYTQRPLQVKFKNPPAAAGGASGLRDPS